MPTTPCVGLPYPSSTDPINVPGDIQALAVAVDTAICDVVGPFLGQIMACFRGAGWTVPTGTLVCDGSAFASVTYPELYALLGNNANTPDLRGTFLRASDISFPNSGDTGGTSPTNVSQHSHTSPVHTHTDAGHQHTVPAHNHTQSGHTHTDAGHEHTVPAHNHTQNVHNHTQQSHNHTQQSHSHTQQSHSHTQVAHGHSISGHSHATDIDHGHTATAGNTIPSTNQSLGFSGSSGAFSTAINQNATSSTNNTSQHSHTITVASLNVANKTTASQSGGLATANATATENSATQTESSATQTESSATQTESGATATNQEKASVAVTTGYAANGNTTATNTAQAATAVSTGYAANGNTAVTVNNAGTTDAYGNLPPFYGVTYVIQAVPRN